MTALSESARAQASLWGERATDWAEMQEGQVAPLYREALDATEVGPDTALLDVGCGAGGALVLAAQRGAAVTGLDATAGLLAVARERLPDAEIVEGDMSAMPFGDASFDVVTGFNAFQFAPDPSVALGEAHRVLRPGGLVAIATWGAPERCDAVAHLKALGALMPPPPPGAPGPFALSEEGALARLVQSAGLEPAGEADVECVWEYPDEATAVRGLLSSGPAAMAIRTAGEDSARAAVLFGLARFRNLDGGYRLVNVFRYAVARA